MFVRLSVYMSCKCNPSLSDEMILMEHYTVAVYNLRICMKRDNSGPAYFKRDKYMYM